MLLQYGGCLVDPPGDVSRAHLQVEGHVVEAPHARVHVGAEGADCALHVWEKTENIIVASTSTNKHSIYNFTMHYFILFFIYRVNYTTYVKKIKKKKKSEQRKKTMPRSTYRPVYGASSTLYNSECSRTHTSRASPSPSGCGSPRPRGDAAAPRRRTARRER